MAHTYSRYPLPLPVLTPATAPVSLTATLDKMILNRVIIEFPLGCCGLAHCKINLNAIQIIPWNQTGYMEGDGVRIEIPLFMKLDQPPYDLILSGYNDDDTYDHTIYFEIDCADADDNTEKSLLINQLLSGS